MPGPSAVPLFLLWATLLTPAQSKPDELRGFLQNYIGTAENGKATNYSFALVDLNDDGKKEVIVYLSSDGWCGTAGCTMLILAPNGASYRLVTRIPAVRPPIGVLPSKSNGWHDIGVVARTNGVEPLFQAILSFDGKAYPDNISDAHRANGKARGKVVLSDTAKDYPLYP